MRFERRPHGESTLGSVDNAAVAAVFAEMGDLLAIRDAGAYGAAMASNYNRRPLPAEVLVDNGQWDVVRRRQTVDDMLQLELAAAPVTRL